MDVYHFLLLATDLSGVHVTVYDMEHSEVVWDGNYENDLPTSIDYYEVESYDLYKNSADEICLELNISIEDDD